MSCGLAASFRPDARRTETLDEATTVQFAGLGAWIPGIGRYDPNDWGLGLELRDRAEPLDGEPGLRADAHTSAAAPSLWADLDRRLALAVFTPTSSSASGPSTRGRALSDAVIDELASDGK